MKMNEILELRKNGATYQEIADATGCTRQWINKVILRLAPELKGTRGNGFDIETIVYKGIYEHFKSDLHESITSFTKKVLGHTSEGSITKMREFIIGEHNSRFSIPQIKKMCDITGTTFEELFERRG